jgi:hypothetical protein
MKALISAFALLSFVAASTLPVLPAQAQAQSTAPTTTKAPATKKAAAKKSTKKAAAKKTTKKKVAKKKAAAPAKAPS